MQYDNTTLKKHLLTPEFYNYLLKNDPVSIF